VIDLDAGKTFFENRIDFRRVDLRQSAVTVQHPFFFKGLLVKLLDRFRLGVNSPWGNDYQRDYGRAHPGELSQHLEPPVND
jgi:hypothetical protein